MNTTPKTDACIKMLREAQMVFDAFNYNGITYFDKDVIMDWHNRIMAMMDYRLIPFVIYTMPDDDDKDTAKNSPILQHIRDFDHFWYAMKNYQLITSDCLRDEFWGLCPDLESITKYLDVMNVKFKDVNYRYETDINKLKDSYNGFNTLVEAGELSSTEAKDMLIHLHIMAKRYNFIMDCIYDVYKVFREMTNPQQNGSNPGTSTDTTTETGNTTRQPAQLSPHNKSKSQPKLFEDFLRNDDKSILMTKLHTRLDGNKSGAYVALVKTALVELGYLSKNARITMPLIREFRIQCSKQAINNKTDFNQSERSEIEQIKSVLL